METVGYNILILKAVEVVNINKVEELMANSKYLTSKHKTPTN